MKKCPKCGKITDSKFCPDCGFDLSGIEASEKKDEMDAAAETEIITDQVADESAIMAEQPESLSVDNNEIDSVSEAENANNAEIAENNNEAVLIESEAVAQAPVDEQVKKPKKKKIGFIIGGVIAAVLLIAIVAISNQPKLVSIDAKYSGPTDKGTLINNESAITVTGTYDDDSTKEVTGWTVEEMTISPGHNYISVTYQDQTDSISVYSPLMSGGQYVASVDEIKSVLYSYNSKYVDGFSGFSADPDVSGKYNYDGSAIDLSVSFTKKSGNESVDVDGSESPDAVIITTMMRSDDFGSNLDRLLSAGAAAFTAVDPEINFDNAYTQIKQCTSDAVDNAEGATATDEKKLDNLTIGTGLILMNGNLLIFYSFKSN